MKTSKFIVLSVLLISSSAFSQEYAFRVLINKGNNEVKSGQNWSPIKVGAYIQSDDEIKVTENACLGLVHKSGKPMELRQSGKYKVADLAAKVSGGTSVLNKYTDFILSANTQKKNSLTATGAVHRGKNNVKIYLPRPEFAIVYNNKVIVNWETKDVPGPYLVVFKSMFGDELAKLETKESSVSINLSDPNFANEDNILVEVSSKTDPNKITDPAYTIKRLSRGDKERIKNILNDITSQTVEETATNKLILAGFYEQNNLLIDAITAYQEAIKLAPDVPDFNTNYNDFLLRNGIKEPAVKDK